MTFHTAMARVALFLLFLLPFSNGQAEEEALIFPVSEGPVWVHGDLAGALGRPSVSIRDSVISSREIDCSGGSERWHENNERFIAANNQYLSECCGQKVEIRDESWAKRLRLNAALVPLQPIQKQVAYQFILSSPDSIKQKREACLEFAVFQAEGRHWTVPTDHGNDVTGIPRAPRLNALGDSVVNQTNASRVFCSEIKTDVMVIHGSFQALMDSLRPGDEGAVRLQEALSKRFSSFAGIVSSAPYMEYLVDEPLEYAKVYRSEEIIDYVFRYLTTEQPSGYSTNQRLVDGFSVWIRVEGARVLQFRIEDHSHVLDPYVND